MSRITQILGICLVVALLVTLAAVTFGGITGDQTGGHTSSFETLGTAHAIDYRTTPPYGSAPLMVRFTATNETQGTALWNFGDGYSSTEQNPIHTYETAGTYTATLTIRNASGLSQTAEIAITAEPPGVVPLPTNEGMVF